MKDILRDFGFCMPSYDNSRVIAVSDPVSEYICITYPMRSYGIFSAVLHLVDRASSLTFRPSEKYTIKNDTGRKSFMGVDCGFGCKKNMDSDVRLVRWYRTFHYLQSRSQTGLWRFLRQGIHLGWWEAPGFPHTPPPLTPSSYFCGVQYSLLGTSYYRRDTQYSRPDFYRKYIAHQPQVCLCISVVDPGCLFRILIFTRPGSRIKKQQQKRGVKKISCQTYFCSHKFYTIDNYFIFWTAEEKNLGQF